MKAQQPIRNPMKSPGPVHFICGGTPPNPLRCPVGLGEDPRCAAGHLGCRAAGECQQQDTLRIRAVEDEVCDAMDERIGFTGSSTRDNEQRGTGPTATDAVFDRSPLAFVQAHKLTMDRMCKHSCGRAG